MTTSRGITDTRVYDRDGVIERYGIPPELVPGLHRAEGRHQRQHPRRPGDRRQDRRRPAAAIRVARGGARPHRRHQRRQAQAEPDRARRRRAHLQAARDRQARHPDRARPGRRSSPAEPDRSTLRDTFREFELREPLRRLEEALGSADAAAPAPAAERAAHRARAATARSTTSRGCPQTEVAIAVRAPETSPRTRCSRPTTSVELRRLRRRRQRGPGRRVRRPEELVAAIGTRPVIAHDAKSLGEVPDGARARHRGRRLPARAGAARLPVPRAVRGARPGAPPSRTRPPPTRCWSTRSPRGSARRSAAAA